MSSDKDDRFSFFKNPENVAAYKSGEAVTGPFASILLSQSGLLAAPSPLVLLDNACGTGIVTDLMFEEIKGKEAMEMEVVCGDVSEAMLEVVKARAQEKRWKGVKTQVVDAERILKPGGVTAFSTWKYIGWYDWAQAAVARVPAAPKARPMKEYLLLLGLGSAWDDPSFVSQSLSSAGFVDVEVFVHSRTSQVEGGVEGFLKTSWPLGVKPMRMQYGADDQEKFASVQDEVTARLREVLTEKFGTGQVLNEMVAITASGRKPEN